MPVKARFKAPLTSTLVVMLVKLNVTVFVPSVASTVVSNAPVKSTGNVDVLSLTASPCARYRGAFAALQPNPGPAAQKLFGLPKNGSVNDPIVLLPTSINDRVAVVIFVLSTVFGPEIDTLKVPFGWTAAACAVAANANRASGPMFLKLISASHPPQSG